MAKRSSSPTRRVAPAVDARGKHLVIVESPAKARTINRYLGDLYIVRASMGHIRDLPERDFGVDLTNNFAPTYVNLDRRSGLIGTLKKMADQADTVFLATDLDREGEAIAWHLQEALRVPDEKARRVIFNQITKTAIQQAFRQPHDIDMDRVNAQQARRILDRIVGYQISPLLSRKIRRGLSAGRVQTVTVRLIVEREREIRAFVPQEYWEIGVELNPDSPEQARSAGEALAALLAGADPDKGVGRGELLAFYEKHRLLRAELVEWMGEKFRPDNGPAAHAAADALARADFRVATVKTTQRQDRPAGPFTTAALQQAGVNQLRFSASQTMRLAQELYEGVELPDEGSVGLITYMRTDSLNLSPESINAARTFIGETFGADFVPESPNRYAASAGAQEAHEAIRPTDVSRTPESLRGQLDERLWRLYDLIWRRFVACQMTPARWEVLTVEVAADCPGDQRGLLRASARKLVFEGHLKVTGRRETAEPVLPDGIAEGSSLWPARVDASQHFTEPPPRYTEATLVKALESEGIGRPSTYAAIIDTIQQRGYVEQQDRRFHPTPLGEVVTEQLVNAFPKIFDVEFTRFMESELDKIENAHADWVAVLREFYEPFSERLAVAGEIMTKPVEPSPHNCPQCGKQLMYRLGKSGRFLGCSGYPECEFTADVNDQGEPVQRKAVDVPCPECGKPMMLRTSRRGPFLGCTGYPECSGTLPSDEQGNPLKVVEPDEIKQACPDCGSPMAVKFGRGNRPFLGCTNYPKCKATAQIPAGLAVQKPKSEVIETGIACDKCGRPMVVRSSRRGPFLACTGFPRCRNARNLTGQEREAVEAGRYLESAVGVEEKPAAKKKATRKKKADAEQPAGAEAADDADAGEAASTEGAKPAAAADYPGELGELARAGCPNCGSPLNLRNSRFGPFLGCANYPKCKTIVKIKGEALKQARTALGLPEKREAKPKPQMTNVSCTKCGEPMVIRSSSSGQFLGCSKYPKCRNTAPLPVELTKSDNG